MAEFTPINTQEEFDAMIKSRLEREANKVRNEFADYNDIKNILANKSKEVDELNSRIKELNQQSADLTSKLSASETASVKTRIAYEMGLPFELCERLTGTNETEIREDAEKLTQLFKITQPAQPLYNPETKSDSAEAALRTLAANLI